jgi:hypothetical protein
MDEKKRAILTQARERLYRGKSLATYAELKKFFDEAMELHGYRECGCPVCRAIDGLISESTAVFEDMSMELPESCEVEVLSKLQLLVASTMAHLLVDVEIGGCLGKVQGEQARRQANERDELMKISKKWLKGEKDRIDGIITRLKAAVDAVDLDREEEAWGDLREMAASLVHTASQLQAQAAVLTVIEPTEQAKKARGG